jgi:hypothetical protein
MKSKLIVAVPVLVVAGVVSGFWLAASTWSETNSASWQQVGISYVPGIVFGIATAILLWSQFKRQVIRAIVWLGFSVGAWYMAVNTYIYLPVEKFMAPHMMAAGLFGALILALGMSFLARPVGQRWFWMVVMAGVLLALPMEAIMVVTENGAVPLPQSVVYPIMFVIWQVGVGLTILGYSKRLS